MMPPGVNNSSMQPPQAGMASGSDMKSQLGQMDNYDQNPIEPNTSRSDIGSSGGQGDILKMLMMLLAPQADQGGQPSTSMMGDQSAQMPMGGGGF